jgi:CheY-like chemotaxis protein
LSQVQGAGWQAAAVGLGPEGITQARQRRPAAIVINLGPSAPGAALFLRALKAKPDLTDIPVLGFCGHRDTGRREAALAAGCDRVVSNSSVTTQLTGLLRDLISETSTPGWDAGPSRPPLPPAQGR